MRPLVLFGGSGDLARAKVLPAILRLRRDGFFPEGAPLVFVTRRAVGVADLIREAALRAPDAAAAAETLIADASAVELPLGDAEAAALAASAFPVGAAAYAALPPSALPDLIRTVGALRARLSRLSVEKPLGRSAAEAIEILEQARRTLGKNFFLVDHYAWKAASRGFASLAEKGLPAAGSVNEVNLRMSETLRVGRRAAFYDEVGAIRDVFQSHGLFLVASAVAAIAGDSYAAALGSLEVTAVARARYDGYGGEGSVVPDVETAAKISLRSSLLPAATVSATFGKALSTAEVKLTVSARPGTWSLEVQPEAAAVFLDGSRRTFSRAGEGYDAYEGAVAAALSGDFSEAPSPEEALEAWRITDAARALGAASPPLPYVPGEEPAW